MSTKASPTAIGGFVIGIVGLAIAMVFFFGGSDILAETNRYDLVYRTSIKGLKVGSPVTLKGVTIGEVIDIKAKMLTGQLDVYNIVSISINKKAMIRIGQKGTDQQLLQDLLDKGIAAQLKLQSLLTGLLFVDVDFHEKEKPRYADVETEHPQFPTVATDFEALSKNLEQIDIKALADDVQQIFRGLDQIINNPTTQNLGVDIKNTLGSIKQLADDMNTEIVGIRQEVLPIVRDGREIVHNINQQLPALLEDVDQITSSLEATTQKLDKTMAETQHLLSDDSPLINEMTEAARGLQKASDQIAELSSTLAETPEALLKGKGGQ